MVCNELEVGSNNNTMDFRKVYLNDRMMSAAEVVDASHIASCVADAIAQNRKSGVAKLVLTFDTFELITRWEVL